MYRLGAISLVLAVVGCSGSSKDGWNGTVRRVGDTEFVQNPATPLRGPNHAPPSAEWVAPTPEHESQEGVWQEPLTVRAADTLLYILDRMADRVYVIDARDGVWTRSFGSSGQGPGELEDPFGLAVSSDGVVVGDAGKASLEFFDTSGAFQRTVALGRLGFGVFGLGNRKFLINALLGRVGGWRVVSIDDPKGQSFAWPEWSQDEAGEAAGCFRAAADPTGIYRVSCSKLTYQLLDHTGGLRQEVTVVVPVVVASEERLQHHLQSIREQMSGSGLPEPLIEQQVAHERVRLHDVPIMRTLRANAISGEIAVWEQEPEELGSGAARLHVFDARGRYVASWEFDAPWVDFDWRGTRLYALEREEQTGLVRLVAWNLAKSS